MKSALTAILLLVFGATSARAAGGVNLNWSNGLSGATLACYSEAGRSEPLATWSCDTDAGGPWNLVASFRVSADMPDFLGLSGVIDGQSAAAALPDWWQLYNQGSCRETSLYASAGFTVGFQHVACRDPFSGHAEGGINVWQTQAYPPPAPLNVPIPSRFRLKVTFVLPQPKSLSASNEWLGFWAQLDDSHTVPSRGGVCTGCQVPLTLVLTEMRVYGQASSETLVSPLANACIFWQSNAVDCYVATRIRTWGQIKSLYR